MFSFANVALSDPDGLEVGAWIEENIRPAELFPLAYRTWPNSLCAGPILDITPEVPRPVRIGTLWWPWGASRFARAHFVVSESQLNSIRQNVQYPVGTPKTGNLVLQDGTNTITTAMWMLPVWPALTAVVGAGAYLLTLVDERYWWNVPLALSVTAGTTAWTDLYASVASALGIQITVEAIPAAYGTPTSDYSSGYRPLPAVLDAIAFSVGQRIVRDVITGAVKAQNATSAIASVTAQLAAVTAPYTGGKLALLPG